MITITLHNTIILIITLKSFCLSTIPQINPKSTDTGTARGDRASRYSKGSVLGGEGGVAAASNSLFSNAEARMQRYSTMSM